MAALLRTLIALIAGAVGALLWVEQRQPSRRDDPPAQPTVERVEVPDPEQTQRIEQLEAELAQQRAMRETPPDEPPPGVDAIRAARARAFELERALSRQRGDAAPRWSDLDTPTPDTLLDAAAEHLPRVAVWTAPDVEDAAPLWRALGALQEFAQACDGDWFEFHGDFPRWCAESGHPASLPTDQLGADESRPVFEVDPRVNRSGRQAAPNYIQINHHRHHYIDDTAGQTHRIHIVGVTGG